MRKAIIIMAKVPLAGNVKTRLRPFLTDQQCAGLATAFLLDAETKARNETDNTIIAFSPSNEREKLKTILHRSHILIEQRGSDLGEKMHYAFVDVFSRGYEAVVMIGTDSPSFPAVYFSDAFKLLESGSDAVLGKSNDGGFYLIGLRAADTRIFENVEWSTEQTELQTTANIRRMGLNLSFLPDSRDIDVEQDLKHLNLELENEPSIAPATVNWIHANKKIFESGEA